MTEAKANLTRKRWAAGIAAALAVCAIAAVAVVLLRRSPPLPPSAHDVPLGVEEAVIVRYAGPRLVARPYRRGASVSVRIAEEVQQDSGRVYDVRYVVNLPGEFDLKDYLAASDGSAIDGLPSFKIRGLTALTKDIETRIQEIESVGVHVWHWYYETLFGLGAVWLLWLAGLVFIGRPKRPPKPAPPPPEPSIEEQIARYLEALRRGGLTVVEKARLEILLLQLWRDRLSLNDARMAAACRRIERNSRFGEAYAAVSAWLHAPETAVGPAEVLEHCGPLVGNLNQPQAEEA